MAKAIIKEIIITLLLILAAILVLMVLFYNYIPNSKVVPKTVSYITPSNVKEELVSAEEVEQSEVIMTYEIDSGDLSNYKRTQDYIAGRKNPFSAVNSNQDTESANSNTSSSGGNTGNSNSSGNVKNSNSNSKDSDIESETQQGVNENQSAYLPNNGTK